jgi:hypothetical protein
MDIELSTQTRSTAFPPESSCLSRLYSSCMRYCYFAPQTGVRAPTSSERLKSAIGGLCQGVFVGAFCSGFSCAIAILCTQAGVPISKGLFLKIVIPIASTSVALSVIHGVLHPPRGKLVTTAGFEPLRV